MTWGHSETRYGRPDTSLFVVPFGAAWYSAGMTTKTKKLMDRIAALPEDERDAVSDDVLEYVDELVALRRQLAAAEEDVKAGRTAPADAVFGRLLVKYAS